MVAALRTEITGTDRGILAGKEKRVRILSLIESLEASQEGKDQLADSRFYRNCEVAYVGQAQSGRANAAGGRFRGRLGRLLFRTTSLFQHVLKQGGATIAVNMINFKLFGLVPGAAVLLGDVSREEEAARAALGARWNVTLGNSTVSAAFNAPRIVLGGGKLLNLVVGPQSNVRLDTTYVDDGIRISRGGRSRTPFVFFADGIAQEPVADAWRTYEAQPSISARTAGRRLMVAAAVCLALMLRIRRGRWLLGFGAALQAVLGTALLRSSGGIVVDTTGDGSGGNVVKPKVGADIERSLRTSKVA